MKIMIGVIEFKKDVHEKHIARLCNLKKEICALYEEMLHEGKETRHEEFDDRRGDWRGHVQGSFEDRNYRQYNRESQGYRQGEGSNYRYPDYSDDARYNERMSGRYNY